MTSSQLPKILKYPHHTLTHKSSTVIFEGDDYMSKHEIAGIIESLFTSLMSVSWGKAVGLAAPQIGINKRIFIALGDVYINPDIIWTTKAPKITSKEGCYSLRDNEFYNKSRIQSIEVKYQDINGDFHTKRFNGHNACVIQHEMDHLMGKLCNE